MRQTIAGFCDVLEARVIRHLIEWLAGDGHESMRRSFELWLKRRLRARMPVATMADPGLVPTLEEIETMFPDLLLKEERRRARKEGRVEGREEGELKAACAALVRLLERRFGPVSPETRKQVEAAEYGTVQQWFDRAIDADKISSVFHPDE